MKNPKCGDQFMWAKDQSQWGCYCCSQNPSFVHHRWWSLYSLSQQLELAQSVGSGESDGIKGVNDFPAGIDVGPDNTEDHDDPKSHQTSHHYYYYAAGGLVALAVVGAVVIKVKARKRNKNGDACEATISISNAPSAPFPKTAGV